MEYITKNFVLKTYIKVMVNNCDDFIYPQDTSVLTACNGCFSPDAKFYSTKTPHPDFVSVVCDKEECKEKARRGMASFLFDRNVQFLLEDPIQNINVKRSNGTIDSNWCITGLWINEDELPDLFVENKSQVISKNIRSNEFLKLNPDLENRLKEEAQKLIEYHMTLFDNK